MQNAIVQKSNLNLNKLLLIGGAVSAPLFFAVAIIQAFTRTGFDIRRHAISTLTLGDLGWIQSTGFIVTGCLSVLAAMGIRSLLQGGKGGVWGPLLIGIYGIGMIAAGLFRPDPGLSFPPGAPEGMPTSMSSSAAIHSLAFFTAFICLVAACFVFARRFAAQGDRSWKTYCLATGIISPLLIAAGMVMNSWIGVIMGCAGLVAFGWVSALSIRLRAEVSKA
ncbi:DUF998 domain-containing protein [Paenibacillus harenae]|uniref:DUF998 domain-containing protein n=1 Tax=Paenibacillus harenae TaxID=306543 RepID=UPI00042682A2|nr:DUF998 domain-containing protein [Paenibacillus harenae]